MAAWVAVLGLAACGTTLATPEPVVLTVVAPDGVRALASDLAAGYQAARPHVTVRVESTGNSLAAESRLSQGLADMALTTRRPDISARNGLTATQVAWDALALIAHPTNPVDNLTMAQVREVFAGQVRNWNELTDWTRPIQVAVREDGSGARAAFDTAVLDGDAVTPTALILPGEEQMLKTITAMPGAIGYVATTWLDDSVRGVKIDGVVADPASGQFGSYPLLLPVYLATPAGASPEVAAFQAWVLSPAGQAVVQQRLGRVR
jgi:phosphate transport system substrate-binding protein